MAEAGGVTGLQPTGPKFFCHKCNQEIPHVLDDFTCPICKGGFIEEVQETAGGIAGGQMGGQNQQTGAVFDAEGFGGGVGMDFLQQIFSSLSGQPGAGGGRGGGGGATNTRNQGPGVPGAQNSYRRTRSDGGSPGSNSHHFSFVINAGPGGGANATGGGQQNSDGMEHMLFSFLNDLITGLGGGGAVGGLPVLSNLGDYVWGRDGLDAIVTQLMNQMEGTGTPPLATEKIDILPDVTVSQDQVDRKLQCSVCWDDFSLNEQVKQLECEHLYHPDCIIPWLKLHGTCPICRKDLTGESTEDPNEVPSARFEPMSTDEAPQGATVSSSDNSSESLRSTLSSTTSSDSFAGRQPGHQSAANQTSINNPSNPTASLLNQLFNPLMFGEANVAPGTAGSAPSGQQQSGQQRDGRTQGPGGGSGLDNMDLDFD